MKRTALSSLVALIGCSTFACSAVTGPMGADGGAASGGGSGTPSPSADGGAPAPAQDAGAGAADAATPVGDAASAQGTVTFLSGASVSTLAGSGVAGTQDGTGAGAQFSNPTSVALDGAGNLVVTDYDSGRVRLVTAAGVVTTLAAGSGFVNPFSAAVASDGTYYVGTDADSTGTKGDMTGTVWRIAPLAAAGTPGMPVVVAQGLGRPRGLAPATAGNLLVADRKVDVIEQVSSSGSVSPVAGAASTAGCTDGSGAAAEFNGPVGVAALPGGGWLVADTNNNRIRQVTSAGVVSTFAGDGTAGINDGPRAGAWFNAPHAIAVDASGNVYVSDTGNHRIRRIGADGNVSTVAGDGTQGFKDGAGAQAELYGQEGIAVSADGRTVYVADGNGGDGSAHHHIRAIAVPGAGI